MAIFLAWIVNEDLSFPLIRDSMFFSLWETGFRSFVIIKYAISKPKTFAEMRSYIFLNFSASNARKLHQFAYSTSSLIEDWGLTTARACLCKKNCMNRVHFVIYGHRWCFQSSQNSTSRRQVQFENLSDHISRNPWSMTRFFIYNICTKV